ncbi:MAG: sce7725 family protein [Planctomycetota bacterium]
MYFPYFRGKQFELIAIRETAKLIADTGFVPVIEPVREQFTGLKRALDVLRDCNAEAVVVVNPQEGDLVGNTEAISDLLTNEYGDFPGLQIGVVVTNRMTAKGVSTSLKQFDDRSVALIHHDFREPLALATLAKNHGISTNCFIGDTTGQGHRIL